MMSAMNKMTVIALGLFMLLGGIPSSAKAQTGIAYIPDIGAIPTGATLTVTPAVSADRRYVRLSVNAYFNALDRFSTFSFPGGAVGGGGGGNFGGGGGGNFGGGGGGNFGGGAGGGLDAGMNGIISDEDDYQSGVQVGSGAGVNATTVGRQSSGLRAGPLPGDGGGPGAGDPMGFDAGMNQQNGFGVMPGFESDEAALMFALENGSRRRVRAAAGDPARSPRRSLRKTTKPKPTRKPSAGKK
jgi:hypothetical protein